MYLKLVSGQGANCKKDIFRYNPFLSFPFLNRGFPRFGLRNSGLFPHCARVRLNSFETLSLKTFGKNAKYRCVPKIGSAGGAKKFN